MNKLTLKRDIVVRWVTLLLAASLFAWTVGKITEKKQISIEGQTIWCFHAEYKTMSDYHETKSPDTAFITIDPGGKVRVFEHCKPIYAE